MQVRVLRRLLSGADDGAALLGAVDHLGRSPDQLAAATGQAGGLTLTWLGLGLGSEANP